MSTKLSSLTQRARENPKYRFTRLVDLLTGDFLKECFWELKRDKASGVDGVTVKEYEVNLEENIKDLVVNMKTWKYRPQPVRRVYIPKPDGKRRPLGIPTVRDRVVQMATVLVLGPIFEADLQPEQYAYRPDRSALDAVQQVHAWLKTGHTEVVDADLSGYFDSIPHAELMKSVARRVSDRHMLHLIKMWL